MLYHFKLKSLCAGNSAFANDSSSQKQISTTVSSTHVLERTFNGLHTQCATRRSGTWKIKYSWNFPYNFSGILPLTETCAVASIIPRDEIATQV